MTSLDFENAAQAAAPDRAEAVLDWHVLQRRKARPLRFRGERLVHLETEAETAQGLRQEIDLFQTEAGGFVVSVALTGPDDIRRPLSVFAADTAEDIQRHVEGLDPACCLPLPHALFGGGSLAEILEAHEDFARRIAAAREGITTLRRRALAALS